MIIKKFEEIIAWQQARVVTKSIYQLLLSNKDYGFKDQIQRASVSIMNNIAEGFERGSNPDFRRFLFIAKGSCAEVRSLLYLSRDLGYIGVEDFERLYQSTLQIGRLLSGLIHTL